MNDCMLMQIQGMDAYISVRGGANVSELADVPADRLNLYSRLRLSLIHISSPMIVSFILINQQRASQIHDPLSF